MELETADYRNINGMIIKLILVSVILIGVASFLYEMRHAMDVDPKEPFLHGDFEGDK